MEASSGSAAMLGLSVSGTMAWSGMMAQAPPGQTERQEDTTRAASPPSHPPQQVAAALSWQLPIAASIAAPPA
jgi:hypothetical protein